MQAHVAITVIEDCLQDRARHLLFEQGKKMFLEIPLEIEYLNL